MSVYLPLLRYEWDVSRLLTGQSVKLYYLPPNVKLGGTNIYAYLDQLTVDGPGTSIISRLVLDMRIPTVRLPF